MGETSSLEGEVEEAGQKEGVEMTCLLSGVGVGASG